MDGRDELIKARVVIGVGVMFLFSAWYSFAELTYLTFGSDVTATVTKVTLVTNRSRYGADRGQQLMITATWADADGTRRKDDFTTRVDFPAVEGGPIRLRTTRGEDGRARPAGQVQWVAIVLFAVSLLAFIFFCVQMVRESNEAYRPRKPRRR